VVQIHPPQPTISTSCGQALPPSIPASTRTSTNRHDHRRQQLSTEAISCDNQCDDLRVAHRQYHFAGFGQGHQFIRADSNLQRETAAVRRCVSMKQTDQGAENHNCLLTEKQAARFLSRSVSSLRRDRRSIRGPKFIRMGRSIRYRASDLADYLDACTAKTFPAVPHA
jgi:hypothetical protein